MPLLDDSMKPEKVVLLVTEKMQAKADFLEQVIKPRNIAVVQVTPLCVSFFKLNGDGDTSY